jgi:hypothetical protein
MPKKTLNSAAKVQYDNNDGRDRQTAPLPMAIYCFVLHMVNEKVSSMSDTAADDIDKFLR